MPDPNAVERRLDQLNVLWGQFADHPTARVLRWQADADARRIIDVFLQLHTEHPAGLPDYFLPFDRPFRDETSYAADLLRAWREWFDAQKDDLIEESRDPTWRPPSPRAGEPGQSAVVRAADSFRRTYKAEFRFLCVALVPDATPDPAAWARWVGVLAKQEIPPEVRFLLVDPAEAPRLAALDAKRVLTQTPVVRMGDVYRELLAEAGGSGPGVVYRKHYVNMVAAAGEGDVKAAEQAGRNAAAVAAAEGWGDLHAAALVGLSGVLMSANRPADALAGYRQAVAAADTIPPEHPAAAILRVQTRMAEAGALFGGKDYAPAAAQYEAAAPLAPDPMLKMECWRMAAACHELLKDDPKAFACGQQALTAGEGIAPDVREKSTLAFAAQGLVRVCGKRAFADKKREVLATANRLLAPGWEARRA